MSKASPKTVPVDVHSDRPAHQPHGPHDRQQRLFESLLDAPGRSKIGANALPTALRRAGLGLDDPRLRDSLARLRRRGDRPLDAEDFQQVVDGNALLIERALLNELVIPDFPKFSAGLDGIFEHAREQRGGAVADYIPQLGRVDPELYAMALCSIDGQQHARGDSTTPFCVQSVCKPVSYCLALEQHGADVVHEHVGCEPSGQSFNELTLSPRGRPHNPMINAGAIMSSALIQPELPMADRFDYVQQAWQQLAGGVRPGFDNATYLSERRTADRNFALGYFMRENRAFPADTELVETLEFYFQCCSIEVTAQMLSVVAGTLANGGVCPLTGERVFRHETVQKCLSLMYSCGMYDFSGEWAFRIGLPAKSGVSGAVMTVIPNVAGLCVWSPRLDAVGNSVRGVAFCRELVETFNFHNYDNLSGGMHSKEDPRRRVETDRRGLLVDLCWAASKGDLDGIRRLRVRGVDLAGADYDGRTALHLAASEGREQVVAYLLEHGVDPAPIDRWGNTPMVDAQRGGHASVAALLGEVPAAGSGGGASVIRHTKAAR